MLRYKKHKRQADGLGTSVNLMDDTDREVSSFTDRAFRSLCVAEEEPFNDVPHVPSPIRGMPLSTKYHLGIFNLSVRKTQPLAQLPITLRQHGKWAPTFQPLLTYGKVGLTDAKTIKNKLCVPVPRGYKQLSKVTSLIQTYDNIENAIPGDSPLDSKPLFSKGSHGDIDVNPKSETIEKTDIGNELILNSINPDNSHLNEDHHLHRRTAREVFLESQTETCSQLSRSPLLSSGSSSADQVVRAVKHKNSLKITAFLHSEHSAFKSWTDINRKMIGSDESNSSMPGTPLIPRLATPCSPLLQRAISGMKARDGGLELGWTSPASSISSSYDPNQVLRTVPPLPNRKNTKQNKESYHKAARTPLNVKNQDLIKKFEGQSTSKEQINCMNKVNKCKSPEQTSHVASPSNVSELNNASQIFEQQKEEGQEKIISTEHIEVFDATSKEEVKEQKKDQPPPGRIKTLIQQIEKEAIKETIPVHFTEKKTQKKEESIDVFTTLEKSPQVSNNLSGSSIHVPPWRKIKSINTIVPVPEKTIQSTSVAQKETTAVQAHENKYLCKQVPEEKPSSFNISNLLTPVIRRKNIHEALEENIVMTPPIDITNKDQDQRELILYKKRDDYKSKATSLLFNLKDMRKRVKSTYNPAITARNSFEKNLITDVNMLESVVHANDVPEINKSVYEIENNNHIYVKEHFRSTRESEFKSKLAGNESENYLSLSPMDHIPALQNGEISEEKVMPSAKFTQEEKEDSQCLSTKNRHINEEIVYPLLNLNGKADTCVDREITGCTEDSLACLNNTKVNSLSGMKNVGEEIKHDECIDDTSNPSLCVMEMSMDIVPSQSKTFFPSEETESKRAVEHDESQKQVSNDDESKEILQYFAVNSCSGVDGIEKTRVLESQIEKEKCQENVTDEKPRAESSCAEEPNRSSTITPFKPNLFCLKDNKIKSSPVTKSVRLPLFRSLSEDCLAFRKLDDNYAWRVGDCRDARESNGISTDILSTQNTEISKVSKHQNHLAVSPKTETSKPEAMEHNQVETYKEKVEDQKLWRKVHSIGDEKNKHETEDSNAINMGSSSKNVLCLEETFFHPVETCVSEVTGLSPECNTLILHNITDSTKELVNGEHIGTHIDSENTIDSPIDNGILQFEDSVSFIEDIACSIITSPMSDSVTCSIVASPMSVNTQSSGFTTALSALEDIPSPSSSSVNTRNGKFNFLLPDSEPKSTNLAKQEKASFFEPQKMHAKPPAVPPKTEKTLRRAKRLTKKRKKTDMPQRDVQESDVVLDVSSPGNLTSTLVTPQADHKLMSCTPKSLENEDIMTEFSTPSLPLTQRKLLLDPDSGRYFMVNIPVCLRIKTFYDPETGKYLQVSLPPSERESPALEMSNSPYMMYPGLTPVPVSSIVSYKGTSQLLNHENVNTYERESLWNDREEDSLKMHSCDSHDQRMLETPLSMDRITSRSSDIISMKDIDDFAMEGVS